MPQLPNDQRAVDRLVEPGEYRSEKITGLILEIRSAKPGTVKKKWRVKFRVRVGDERKFKTWTIGDARKIAIGAAEAEARKRLAQVEITKKDPRKDTTGETFDALVRDWIEKHGKANKRSWARDLRLYEHRIAPLLGSQVAANIDRQDVIAALDHIAKSAVRAGVPAGEGKGIQANRCQALISACYSWALDEGRVSHHPAIRIRKRAKENASERFLTTDELFVFWKALDSLPQVIARPLRLLAILGQRDAEVARLPRSELELRDDQPDAPSWTLPPERAKNGRRHMIPLPSMAKSIISQTLAEHDAPFVFTTRVVTPTPLHPTTLSSRFCDLMRDLKIEGATLHTLRHTVKTNMAALGVPDNINDRVMNQVTGQRQRIGSRYDHHEYLSEKRRALELWEARLQEIVEGRRPAGLHWDLWRGARRQTEPPADDPALDAEYGPVSTAP